VTLSVHTLRAPLWIEKTLTLRDGPALFINEVICNIGAEPFNLMWGHHPALGPPFLDATCVIDLPAHQGVSHPVERFATQPVMPNQQFIWPNVRGLNGANVDFSRTQAPASGTADLVYLTNLTEGWYAVTNQDMRVSFGMAWTLESFPYLWYWHDANGTAGYPWYGRGYVLALEPWSSYPSMGLAESVARNTHITLQPGERRYARLTATMATDLLRVGRVTLEGIMTPKESL
jgi:hypothetical protein